MKHALGSTLCIATVSCILVSTSPVMGDEDKAASCDKPCVKVCEKAPKEFMGLPLLLDEDFDKPAPDQWMPSDPAAWKFTTDGKRTVYSQHKMSNYKPPVRSPHNVSLYRDLCVSDFVLDAWMKSTRQSGGHRDMCVFFGYQDPQHMYYAHLGKKADAVSNKIHRVNGKPREPIAKTSSDGCAWTDDTYHHVRVVRNVEKGTIAVYFDDMNKPAMTAEDKTFTIGRIGVGSFDDTGNVDRIILWGKKAKCPATQPCPQKKASQNGDQ